MSSSQQLSQGHDQIILEKPAPPPSISRKTGSIISIFGYLGTLSAVVSCALLRSSPYLPYVAVLALCLWIVMKIGKTIVKKHDQAAYELERYQDSLNGD